MLPWRNRDVRNTRIPKGEYSLYSRTAHARGKSGSSRSLGLFAPRSGRATAEIHRRSRFGLFFFVAAVVLGLAAALLLQADGRVAHAQQSARVNFSLIEVDPLTFEEHAGTVRFGVQAETIGADAPTIVEVARVETRSDTARPSGECEEGRDYGPLSDEVSFAPADFEAFVNDEGETRYRQIQYLDVLIWDDRTLEEDESFKIVVSREPASGPPDSKDYDFTIIDNDGFVGVAFDQTAITVTEGTDSSYRLALGSLPSGNVTVTIVDPSNTEVTAEPGAVTFTPTDWYVPQTVTVSADHDGDAADEAVFAITHLVNSVGDGNFEGLTDDSVTVTVIDDDGGTRGSRGFRDDDTPAVRDGNDEGPIPEGAVPKIDFALMAPEPVREPAGKVRIGVVASTYSPGQPSTESIEAYPENGTATWDGDYTVSGVSNYDLAFIGLTFPAGDFEAFIDIEGNTRYRQVQYFDIDLLNDYVAEDREAFEVHLDAICISVGRVYVTIIDDDPIQVEYSLVEAGPFDEDAGTVQVEVMAMTNQAGVPVVDYGVRVQSEDGTARSGDDYEVVDEALEFAADDFVEFLDEEGETRYRQTVSFDVVLNEDELHEDTETFLLKLMEEEGHEGAVFGVPDIEVSITDDDAKPKVTLALSRTTIDESGANNATTVTATLSAASSEDTTVTVSVDPTGSTTLSANTVLTIDAGQTSSSGIVTITAADDSAYSGDRQVAVQGSAVNTAGVDGPDDVTLSITEDDAKPVVTLALSPSTIGESGATNATTVTASLSAASSEDTTVTVSVDPTGSTTLSANTVLTIDAGQTSSSGIVTITATDDSAYSGNRQVAVKGAAVNSAGVDGPDDVTLNITDDDAKPVVTLALSPSTIGESGATNSSIVTATLSAASGVDTTVTVSVDPTDTTTLSANTQLTITAGETDSSGTVTITAADDSAYSGNRQVAVMGAAVNSAGVDGPDDVTLNITDDDAKPVVTLTLSPSTIGESGATNATTVTASLSAASSEDTTVTVSVDPTDTTTLSANTVLTIDAGETDSSGIVTITAADDSAYSGNRQVAVQGSAVNTAGVDGPDDVTLNIDEDEAKPVEVSFGQDTYSATEGGDDAEVTVRLSAPAPGQVHIPVIAEGHYKATPDDWSGVPQVLTFNTGDTQQAFTVVAVDDTVEDNGEMVELSFGNLPDGFVAGSPATAKVTLINDDFARSITRNEPDGLGDFDSSCAGTRATLTIGEPFEGRIGSFDDVDAIRVEFAAGSLGHSVSFRNDQNEQISAQGRLFGMVHPDQDWGLYVSYPYLTNWVDERDSLFFIPEETRTYCLQVAAKTRDFEGDYSILVAEAEDPLDYAVTGAESNSPDGDAVQGIPSDPEEFHRISVGTEHAIAGEIRDTEDRDWYITKLANGIYRATVEGYATGKGTLRGPGIRLVRGDGREYWRGEVRDSFVPPEDVGRYESRWVMEFEIVEADSRSDLFHLDVWSHGGATGTYSVTLESVDEFTLTEGQSQSQHQEISNTPATGWPGITGLSAIGEVLTATVSGIDDADGLQNASFTYQWVRHDPATNTDTDIQGATGSTYTVTRQDGDRAIKVRVEFTDDGGNDERLTSFAVPILPPVNTPAEGQPTIAGTPEVGEILTAHTTGISDVDGMHNATFRYQWIAGGSEIQNATGMSLTLTEDEEGLAIRVSVTFTDDAGNEESRTSAATDTVRYATQQQSSNSPATGAPTISGTAQVEETLTADTSGIADADGVTGVSYGYQWIRNDGIADTGITGATGPSYTLTEADEGLTIKVKVSFTDDAGNEETLTSQPTIEVASAGPHGTAGAPSQSDWRRQCGWHGDPSLGGPRR